MTFTRLGILLSPEGLASADPDPILEFPLSKGCEMWDGTALSLHTLYSQAPENEATQAWDTKGATKDKSPCRLRCSGSWPMNRIAFLSIWARSKVLYDHSWLNKLEEPVPSSSAVAMRMEYQCNTKSSRRKTENRNGKNREFNYQSKEYFPSRLNKLLSNTEWVLQL